MWEFAFIIDINKDMKVYHFNKGYFILSCSYNLLQKQVYFKAMILLFKYFSVHIVKSHNMGQWIVIGELLCTLTLVELKSFLEEFKLVVKLTS